MSSSKKSELILEKISSSLLSDLDHVLKCEEIPREIKDYYLVSLEPFLKKHEGILDLSPKKARREESKKFKEILRAADFYCGKAREFFSFFGIDFADPSNSKSIDIQDIDSEIVVPLLYSSVQLLYVALWEVFSEFLRPLEKLYYLRLCHSGLFPQKRLLFPDSAGTERMELDFLSILEKRSAMFRVNESLPFELRILYQTTSDYFKKCFEEGKKKTGVSEPQEFIDDFISLFSVRNNVCHFGKDITIQEISEERIQSLLFNLSTLLPKIQNSCIGIIGVFGEMAGKEVGN